MRHTIIAVAGLLPILAVPLQSQRAQFIEPGARVRFEACTPVCRTDTGHLVAFGRDSIVLAVGKPVTRLALPLASVTRLETPRGRKSKMVAGAIIGGLVVGSGSYATWAHICDPGEERGSQVCGWGVVSTMALAGTGGGFLLGGLIGALIKTDRWEEVPLNPLRVQPVATLDGRIGLAASVSF